MTASTTHTDVRESDGNGAAVGLRASALAKSFGATRALTSASLELRKGEIHAVVGENGSGKSTLVKILSGVHRPDAGQLELDGQLVARFRNPRGSQSAGIATVFQEVLVVEPRSVLENVWLGADALLRVRISTAEKRRRAAELLAELLPAPLPLEMPIEALSLSDRQACCVARALLRDPRVIILDESTSALDVATRDRLFSLLRRIAGQGRSVIFISHRMDEIAEIADRCTVMRSGETVATLARSEAAPAELVRLMTGARHLVPDRIRDRRERIAPGVTVLQARGVVLRPGSRPIDFDLREGELVGLAGLEGHGQDTFIRALAGGGALSGEVVRRGKDEPEVRIESPAQAATQGIGYVPRERRAESLFESKSIQENFGIVTLDQDARAGLLRPKQTRRRLSRYVESLGIKLAGPDALITTLSGGNQQKIVMARWLAKDPRVLLLNDPTRGVDINAKRDLYGLLGSLVSDGVAIVMLSTEVDEHVEIMDRVIVFRDHQLATELSSEQLSRQALVSAFFGDTHA